MEKPFGHDLVGSGSLGHVRGEGKGVGRCQALSQLVLVHHGETIDHDLAGSRRARSAGTFACICASASEEQVRLWQVLVK